MTAVRRYDRPLLAPALPQISLAAANQSRAHRFPKPDSTKSAVCHALFPLVRRVGQGESFPRDHIPKAPQKRDWQHCRLTRSLHARSPPAAGRRSTKAPASCEPSQRSFDPPGRHASAAAIASIRSQSLESAATERHPATAAQTNPLTHRQTELEPLFLDHFTTSQHEITLTPNSVAAFSSMTPRCLADRLELSLAHHIRMCVSRTITDSPPNPQAARQVQIGTYTRQQTQPADSSLNRRTRLRPLRHFPHDDLHALTDKRFELRQMKRFRNDHGFNADGDHVIRPPATL